MRFQPSNSSHVRPPSETHSPLTPGAIAASPAFSGWPRWQNTTSTKLSVGKKIILGYGISLGLAVLGTTTGLLVGNYYQTQARQAQQVAQAQVQLLSRLQVTMSQFRPEREFFPAIRDETRFQAARTESFQRLATVDRLLSDIRASLEPETMSQMGAFLTAFEAEVLNYRTRLEAILQTVDPETLDAATVERVERQMADFVNGPVYLRLFRFSDELTQFVEQAEAKNQHANLALDRAEQLRTHIILGSMVLSIAIAGLLAVFTSRAITRPIQQVTQVAKQVTDRDDFSLQAPVITQDEIGVLAIALNDLIRRVADYTRELQETQAHLIQSEKMSSLGQMVAGIAHEINNPVNFIYGNLIHTHEYASNLLHLVELFQQEYPALPPTIQAEIERMDLAFVQEDLPKLLASMKMGAERIRQIVLSLRNFSRLDEAEMKAVDLHEGLDSTLLLLSNRLKRGIHVVQRYGDLPPVECYPAQLNQVFMNILSNAIDALLESDHTQKKTIAITTEVRSPHVCIHIQDNGMGIPAALLSKLFDPFFTTKPIGQGTGLGLAISYQIVQRHCGDIEVESSPQSGTKFSIILPIKKTEQPHPPAVHAAVS